MIFASSAALSVSEVQPLKRRKMSDCRSLPTVVRD